MKTKVLITGVAGMIGSHLSRYLLDKGYEVYGIDDFSGGYEENLDPRVKFSSSTLSQYSYLEIPALSSTFEEIKPDYVYHLAAYAAEGLSPFIRNFNYTNNLTCSVNVINECIKHDVKKVIFTSSMAVYGNNPVPYTEDMQPNPADPYGIAKYAVEMDLKQAHAQFGLRYSIVRPHNVVGIYQNIWDRYRNVIGIWIRKLLNNEPIQVFGDGEQKRAFSHVAYILEPLEKLMTIGDGEIFNLGSDKEYTLNEMANMFDVEIEHVEQRHEIKNAYCSHSKAGKVLGFKDDTKISEVITEMIKWARIQPKRQVKSMSYEIDKKMYNYWK